MFTFIARFGRKLMTYLITGATGEIGSRLVKQLLQSNIRPRIFVRDLPKARSLYGDSVDITTGDLGDPAALRAAFAGVDVLFLLNSGPELIRRDAVAAQVAKSVGVQRLVKFSSMDARKNWGRASGMHKAKPPFGPAAFPLPLCNLRVSCPTRCSGPQ